MPQVIDQQHKEKDQYHLQDNGLVNPLPSSQYEHHRMRNLQESILRIKDHTFPEVFDLELLEGSRLHLPQIDHEKVHQHVLTLRVQHDGIQSKVQVKTEKVQESVAETHDY